MLSQETKQESQCHQGWKCKLSRTSIQKHPGKKKNYWTNLHNKDICVQIFDAPLDLLIMKRANLRSQHAGQHDLYAR